MNDKVLVSVSWMQLLKIALVGGLATAIFSKVADAALARWQRRSQQKHQTSSQTQQLKHQRELQELQQSYQEASQGKELAHQAALQLADQQHQRQLQQEARAHELQNLLTDAHFKAREELLVDAADAKNWITHEWGVHHGLDGDWVPEFEPTPALSTVTDVLQALMRIESRHPTRSVRAQASRLGSSVSAHYGSIYPEWDHKLKETVHATGTVPSADLFARWASDADQLIDLLHTAPLRSEAERPPDDGAASQVAAHP